MAHRCDAEAIKAAGLDLTPAELADIQKEVNRLLRHHREKMSDAEVMDAIAKAADQREAEAIRRKAREARNFEAKVALQQFAVSAMGVRKSQPWIGFRAAINPIHGKEVGLRDSVYTTYNGMRAKYFDEMFRSKLLRDDPALMKLFLSGEAEAGIATAKWRLNRGEALDGIDPNAAKIAQRMHESDMAMLTDLRRRGVYVGEAADYVDTTTYEWMAVKRVDPKTFAQKMRERFDLRDPIDDPAEELAIYERLHEKIVSGVFGTPEENFGRGSRVKRIESPRNFIPKSPEAWLEHVAEFGHGTLRDNWLAKVDARARLVALVDRLGPSYNTNLESAFKNFVAQNIADPEAKRKALSEGWDQVRQLMKQATGEITRTFRDIGARGDGRDQPAGLRDGGAAGAGLARAAAHRDPGHVGVHAADRHRLRPLGTEIPGPQRQGAG